MKLSLKDYEHVIWDWNGTLLDDTNFCISIINEILNDKNLPSIDLIQYKKIFTFPVIEYYRAAGIDVSGDKFEKISEIFIEKYETGKLTCSLHPRANEILKFFQENKISQSVLSAYSQHTLEEIISNFNLSGYFIKLVGLNNIYATSKLENGKQWIQELDVNPKKVLLIGDTLHDYEVAESIGVNCVLLSCGHQSRERLLSTKSLVFDSLEELLRMLANF